MRYYSNPACRCARCSTRGLMGPAVLVTLGLLFLLSNMSDWQFERTWPILLIVIGAVKVLRYVVPDTGHWNPGQYAPPYAQYPYGQYPPQPPYAGTAQNGAGVNGEARASTEVHNGNDAGSEVHNG